MISRRSLLCGAVSVAALSAVGVRLALARAECMEAANQVGFSIFINPCVGSFACGDVITIDGVHAINTFYRRRKLNDLRQFVVTANVKSGDRIMHIYPAIYPLGLVEHPTVDRTPARNATIRKVV